MAKISYKKVLEQVENQISSLPLGDEVKSKILNGLFKLREEKTNILIVGATGAGKSSTINALFGLNLEIKETDEFAEVGNTPNPQTMEITKYELDNLILWDSPGLGDSGVNDGRHAKKIRDLLFKKDEKGNALIDLVLVIVDSSNRDLGTTYKLINQVIIPNIQYPERVVVALNKCDKAISPSRQNPHPPFDFVENKPLPYLVEFLETQTIPVIKQRIFEGTGVHIDPVYYSADNRYNISKLLYLIIKSIPEKKRLIIAPNMNSDSSTFDHNDDELDYNAEIEESFLEALVNTTIGGAEIGGDIGEAIGELLGKTGGKVGKFLGNVGGGATGAVVGAAKGIYNEGKKIWKSIFN